MKERGTTGGRSEYFFVIVLCWVLGEEILYAQLPSQHRYPPTVDSATVATFHFNRMLSTFLWNGTLRTTYHYEHWSFNLFQSATSRVFRSTTSAYQDDYGGSVGVQRYVNEWLTLSVKDTVQIVRSNRALDVGSLSVHRFLTGIVLSLPSSWSLGVNAGYEGNRQASFFDKGTTILSWLSNPMYHMDEFLSRVEARFEYSDLHKRKPYDGEVFISLSRAFTEDVVDSLSLSYQAQRRQFYTGSDNLLEPQFNVTTNLLSRTVNTIHLTNALTIQSKADVLWKIHASYSKRTIFRSYHYKLFSALQTTPLDTRIEELQLLFGTSFSWNLTRWWSLRSHLQYLEREESHAVIDDEKASVTVIEKQQADARRLENISKRSMLSFSSTFVPTVRDSITCETTVTLLRYDTPDTTNYDDRDELWINAGVEYVHSFSPVLTWSIRSDIYLDHLVYISRRQSANNNWNRVLRLECKSNYQPSEMFRTMVRAEVLANYTVSDYEHQRASIKSYAFRQFRFSDSTMAWLTQRLGLIFEGSVRLYERGILRWREFRERPEQYFVEYTLVPSICYAPTMNQRIQVGYRLFVQEQYRYERRKKSLENILRFAGPTVLCQLETSFCRLAIEGWYERQSTNRRTVATIPNLSLTTFYSL